MPRSRLRSRSLSSKSRVFQRNLAKLRATRASRHRAIRRADSRFFFVSMFARPGRANFGDYGASADLAFGLADGLSDLTPSIEFIDTLPSDWARIGRLTGFARFDYDGRLCLLVFGIRMN